MHTGLDGHVFLEGTLGSDENINLSSSVVLVGNAMLVLSNTSTVGTQLLILICTANLGFDNHLHSLLGFWYS